MEELIKEAIHKGVKVAKREGYTREVDEALEEMLKQRSTSIKVVGVGGAGNNTITRMSEVGIKDAELIAVNTDAQDLLCTIAHKKILIGKELTKGLGAGANPKIGREAAKESEQEIKEALKGADMIFITCGLGGGTGSGAAPIVAEIAKKIGALTIAVVTLPFTAEGAIRRKNATEALEELEKHVDTLIVIPNDKLLEIAPDLPLPLAFKLADEVLTNAVKGIAELVTKPGLINLDFADVKAIMSSGGLAMIGIGESDTQRRAEEAVERAIHNPLLDVDITGAKGALVNVIGGEDLKIEEANKVVEVLSKKLSPDANIIMGAQISPDLKDTLRVLLIVTGVRSPQIFGRSRSFKEEEKKRMEEELGIPFLEGEKNDKED